MNYGQTLFHPREIDWSSYGLPHENHMVVLDTRSGDRRLLAQSPIPMEYMEHPPASADGGPEISERIQQLENEIGNYEFALAHWNSRSEQSHYISNDDAESDGYGTPDEEFDDAGSVGDGHDESPTTTTREKFTTPCGQTYWVDREYLLYTNETVEFPIGYWSVRNQSVYFEDCWADTDDDDEDDEGEYDPPPTPPPMYEQGDSARGSQVPLVDEVEGETIVFTGSQ